jgi:oxaloacetate decarboxylase (Na+ extruding) subunit gamma
MTIGEMFGQSGILALLGMGVVFGFLVILVVSMSIIAKMISAFGWEKAEVRTASVEAGGSRANDEETVAASTAAVLHHKKIRE